MKVDARGYACPQPVMMAKKAIENNNEVEILVDNNTAKNNILRFANSGGYTASAKDSEISGEYLIHIVK